jgi:hypothetical protein
VIALDTILARAATYMDTFVNRFSNVVAEESYSQSVRGPGWESAGGLVPSPNLGFVAGQVKMPERREVKSDILFMKDGTAFGWMVVRDSFEVDGKPVRDRQERWAELIAAESAGRTLSARLNLGPGFRSTNTPELSLLFLRGALQPRFAFTLGPRDRSLGDRVWRVDYRETARPSLIRGDNDSDLPASGRYWIDADSGVVVQAEVTLTPPNGRWTLTSKFRPHEEFGIALPIEMDEYQQLKDTQLNGKARYSRFRVFTTAGRLVQ